MGRRRGRPSLSGKRKPCGRLTARAVAADRGNDRVQALRAAFAMFQGGKAGNELGDPIGKAWVAGLLDGFAADGQAMRDAGREYGRLWRSWFGELGVRTSSPERLARIAPGMTPTGPAEPGAGERRFERMEAIVAGLPIAARRNFYALCVEQQDSDALPAFVERLINERMALKGRQVRGPMPIRGDRERLEQAADVLEALVDGSGQRRAAA